MMNLGGFVGGRGDGMQVHAQDMKTFSFDPVLKTRVKRLQNGFLGRPTWRSTARTAFRRFTARRPEAT